MVLVLTSDAVPDDCLMDQVLAVRISLVNLSWLREEICNILNRTCFDRVEILVGVSDVMAYREIGGWCRLSTVMAFQKAQTKPGTL